MGSGGTRRGGWVGRGGCGGASAGSRRDRTAGTKEVWMNSVLGGGNGGSPRLKTFSIGVKHFLGT